MATILVADSKVYVRDAVQRRLGLEGHVVAVASTATEAIERLSIWRFDLLVIDHAMLTSDHLGSICSLLQQATGTRIVVMAREDVEDVYSGLEDVVRVLRIAGTLSKPISYGKLYEVVERALA